MAQMNLMWVDSEKWYKYRNKSKSVFSDQLYGDWFDECYERVFGGYSRSFDKNAGNIERFLRLFLDEEVTLIGVFKDHDHLNRPRWCFHYL